MNHRLVTFGLFLVPLGCAEPETYSETRDASTFTSPVDQLGCIKYGVDVEVSGLLARVPPEDASTSPETGSRNDLTLRLPRTACAAPLPLDGYLPAISGVQDIFLAVTSMDRDCSKLLWVSGSNCVALHFQFAGAAPIRSLS